MPQSGLRGHDGRHPGVPLERLCHPQREPQLPPLKPAPGRIRRPGHAVPHRRPARHESAEAGRRPAADFRRDDQPPGPPGAGRSAGPQSQPRRPARHHRT
ncbi:hypothetical protein G6F50_017774 [Rhizopus delemar]|uniref:Uncharacterized protein n=1 Tax=Rhizopus delemar TaxID=936053 RepID=A0A9P7BZB2_9FUNG|nr:hypothetical protein G6F50_017774 [Rhizopus delemar]